MVGINEKNVRWTDFTCEECNNWLLYDANEGIYFCEKCGLVKED